MMNKLRRLGAIKLTVVLLLSLSVLLTIRYYSMIYAIGDTGPAGGIVFYITSDGFHGLEATPEVQLSAPWGCLGTDINGADGAVVGTGAQNTSKILNGCAEAGIAARVAGAYVLNGYEDWFLPSKDELNLMYLNIGKGSTTLGNVGGFADVYYWSSSEISSDIASIQYFGNLIQIGGFKNLKLSMRAVRAF